MLIDTNESPRRKLLNFYVSAVVAGAAVALVLAAWNQEWGTWRPLANALTAVVCLALAAELSSVSMHIGTSTMSIVHIPLIAAIFLFPPVYSMLVGATTLLIVEAFVRRKPWIKIVFNISKEILALGAAASAYVILGGHPSTARFEFVPLAFIGAEIAYSAVTSLAVSYAVSLSEGFEFGETWLRVYGGSFVYDIFSTPLPVLLTYLYVWQQLPGVVLLAVPLLVVRHIYVQNLRLEQSSRELLELMVKNIEARDPYTSGHSQRVSQYARILAKESGISFRQVEMVATAGLLHDVGKTYSEFVPLLLKEGRLTADEKNLLQTHPVRSAELVATISTLRGPIEEAVRHHHENFDGTGYPDGLAGQGIPIGARIIMIADTLDAMTTDRPYRKALPFDRALDEIRKFSGKQFDPRLAEIANRSTAIRLFAVKGSPSALASGHAAFERAGSVRKEHAVV
jgi:HD-GYP domain-containing protein (c-di-GMP phosphodiesterase class II)